MSPFLFRRLHDDHHRRALANLDFRSRDEKEMRRAKKKVWRIVLKYPNTISHSVFIREYDRGRAEEKALRQNPEAVGIDRSSHPQT